MIIVIENRDDYFKWLEEIPSAWLKESLPGFEQVSKTIVKAFQEDQLSGRKADDTGLNIKTKNLYTSLTSAARLESQELIGEVGNKGATYWEYHQTGTERLKKRLFFDEFFQGEGADMYVSAADEAFEKVAA